MRTPADDLGLLRDFAAGRREALGELASRHERALLGLALGLVGDEAGAREVVQEMWLRVIRHAATFRGGSTVKTWLYRIVINQCHDHRAREQRQRRVKGRGSDDAVGTPPEPETNAVLHEAVAALPEDRRVIVLLCYHADMTHEQAAAILEIPVGTLKSRLHAALKELRTRLGAEVTA